MNERNREHVHILYDEMKELSEKDLSKASAGEIQRLMEIDEKAHCCSVCRERYDFFMDSATVLGWGKPAKMPIKAGTMYCFDGIGSFITKHSY